MGKVLVIGCGGVAGVAIQKCAQNDTVFDEIVIASRTVSKCDALAEKLKGKTKAVVSTAQVDADNVEELVALINRVKPDIVLNLALPYQDLTIMDACLKTGVDYVDTANYEAEDTNDPAWRKIYEERCKEKGFTAYFDYSWQWAYRKKFEEAGITGLLGTGFDPGVTSVFSAYALKHYFDEIHYIDILDCNGGDHGYPFATNFNPEINLREVSANGSYWENGHWVETEPMEIKREYKFYGLRTELPYPYEVSGKCGHAAHGPGDVRRKGNRTHPVFEGAAARPGIPGTPYRRKNQYRLYFYRREGRRGEIHLYLQCVRPSGML